jgi:hypothetical protein
MIVARGWDGTFNGCLWGRDWKMNLTVTKLRRHLQTRFFLGPC